MAAAGSRLLVVLVVLFSLLTGTAAASPADHSAPLDTGFEKVGEVTLDGTTYDVYRYDNLLPYASGYEFFADGDRVENAEKARRVARAYAWNRALKEKIDEEDVRTLRDVGRTAERAGTVVSAPLGAIETALAAIDEAKQRERLGVSVWDVAVSALPELSGVESALRATRDELREWDERVGDIGEDVTDVAEAAELVRAGGEAEYDELPGLFKNASEGLREAEEISDGIASDLSRVAETTDGIAEDLGDVRRVGDELASPFRRLSTSLGEAATTVDEFRTSAVEMRGVVEGTRNHATRRSSALFTGWNRRQNAAPLVYGTGVALALAVVAGAYGYRRRKEIKEWYSSFSSSE